jgi:hypothetical protein
LVNARDLGGIAIGSGGQIGRGRLYRSETPQLMTPADVARAVGAYGVRRVIDLRGERGGGSGLLGAEGRGVVIDYFATAGGFDGQRDLSADGFLPSQLDLGAPVVGLVLEHLVGTEGATLIHCHTGKDRTGFVIAMVLAMVGVDDEQIVADYVRSSAVFPAMMANLAAAGMGVPDDAPHYARHAPSAVGITAMLARLRSGWPDPQTYLTSSGVDSDLIRRACRKLTGA